MPLLENIKIVIKKYDLKSYSPNCNTYFNYNEEEIFFMLVNEGERGNKDAKTIAEDLVKGKRHSSVRGYYFGNSLKEFNHVLNKYFKLVTHD